MQHENSDGVEDQVHDCAHDGGGHGVLRRAVRTNDAVAGGREHVKGQTDQNRQHVRMGIVHTLRRYAEEPENIILPHKADERQQYGAEHRQRDAVADAAMGFFRITPSQRQTEQRGGAVADQQRNSQRDHREGINYVGGGVAPDSPRPDR